MSGAITRVGIAPARPSLLFEDPDSEIGHADYQCGKWRAKNRWRGYTLERRRSRRPFLASADGKVRIPVRVLPGTPPEEPGDIF